MKSSLTSCGLILTSAMSLAVSVTLVGQCDASARAGSPTRSARAKGEGRTVIGAFGERKIFRLGVSQTVAAGERNLLDGKFEQAAQQFRNAINANSRDVNARCGLGIALAMQFKLDGADQQFTQALGVDPKNALAHTGKALVALNRLQSSSMTVIAQRQSMLNMAESECRKALQKDGRLPEAHVVLGMVLREKGNLDQAASEFRKATDADPNFSLAHSNLGLVELQRGNTASAINEFKDAITARSSNAQAHYGLGKAYLSQGLVNDALKELNTALYLNRNSAPIHTALGDCFKTQGNLNAAIKEYQAAIQIKAENQDAYMHLSEIRDERGDLELSIAELRSGLELNPNSYDLHRRIADTALRLEKLDDSEKEYKVALAINPGDAAAVKGLTRTYFLKTQKEANGAFFVSNNFEAAEQMIQQAIRLNPNDMELRLADAKLRAMSGRPVDLSLIGNPTNDAERIAYAEAALAQQKFDVAAQMMATVIANSNEPKQVFAVADMACLIHDLDSAEAAYKKAQTMPNAQSRAQRGLDQVGRLREGANKNLRLAKDLAMRKQLSSAIDTYRQAAFENPRLPDAHFGLAEALKRLFPKNPASLREAAQHYRSYIALSPNMPPKEQEKFTKLADKLLDKAYKIERKQQYKD